MALRAKIEDDIEIQRRTAHATLAGALTLADPKDHVKLLTDFVEGWIDIPARLYLFRFEYEEDTKAYFEVLDYLRKREGPIWDSLAPALGGEDAVKIVVGGRISHWKAKAIELARNVVANKSSPKKLIRLFMKKHGIIDRSEDLDYLYEFEGVDGKSEKVKIMEYPRRRVRQSRG